MTKASLLLGALVLLLAFTVTAHARDKTIASPAAYLSTDQTRAMCTVRNVGKKPIAVHVGIFDQSGASPSLSVDNCNVAPLAAGTGCVVWLDGIATNAAYACSASAPSVKDLRGVMMLMDNASFVGRTEPLR